MRSEPHFALYGCVNATTNAQVIDPSTRPAWHGSCIIQSNSTRKWYWRLLD